MYKVTAPVSRVYTGGKVGTVTLEVPGTGKYPERLTFKSFNAPVIAQLAKLDQGETVTLDFTIQTEKVMSNGQPLVEQGRDGKEYPVKVPMLVVTGISTGDAKAVDTDNVPF